MMQIGMTASVKSSGGLDRYFNGLLRAMAPLGVETRGFVVGEPAEAEALGIAGVESFAASDASLLARWSGMRRSTKHRLPGCDIVVSHFAPYTLPVLDQIRSYPTVIHYHGSWAGEGATENAHPLVVAAKHALESIVYRAGATFIVLTNAVSLTLQREFNVAPQRIRVIPGGVDIERFRITGSRAEAREALGLPQDRPIVLTARRLVRAKGIEPLIDAIELVRKQIPRVLLVIVGTGPLAETLRETVRERGLEDNVHFTGFIADADLRLAYRAADLFVVPTIAMEGFGLVVIEALACGTPALVTPVEGLPETVRALDPNLIFRSTAPLDLAAGILGAFDGTIPLPDSATCRAYAERFDWALIAEQVLGVYKESV